MDAEISGRNSQGEEFLARLIHLGQHHVSFEVHDPNLVFRHSEVLTDCKIVVQNRSIYTGQAVLKSLVGTSSATICEATLNEPWADAHFFSNILAPGGAHREFSGFVHGWQKQWRILPEYKVLLADMQTFFVDLRAWLDQAELGIRSAPADDRVQLEKQISHELGELTAPVISDFFERFERVAERVENEPADQRAAHSAFAKRLLHPLLLCSPFLYRTFRKPLGYAGDYEMVNMIYRDPLEGATLYARVVNFWFLQQAPAEAHRNRIQFLSARIAEVAARAAQAGRVARIVTIGCGPALEVQRFMSDLAFSDHARFTLLDFNEETVEHTRSVLDGLKQRHHRATQIEFVRKSVNQILKDSGTKAGQKPDDQFDFVYCAGLFDYLSDQMCHRLSNILYEWVAPGGLFVTTNVDSSNPRRLTMDYIMDWHLIYRSGREFLKLKPARAPVEGNEATSDNTGVNIYYTVRKPDRG